MGVIDFEDKIELLKNKHRKKLAELLELIQNGQTITDKKLFEFHQSGVDYFNAFERTLDEYSLPEINLTEDVINRKIEDTLNVIETILLHWNTVNSIIDKYSLAKISPSPTSYASIQRIIKRFQPDMVTDIREKFIKANLPIYGFDSKKVHSGWKKTNYFKTQLILGIILLTVCGILIFSIKNITGMQFLFIKPILSLSISLIGVSTIEGTLKVNWTMKQNIAISATGWVGIFILLYFLNPPTPPTM